MLMRIKLFHPFVLKKIGYLHQTTDFFIQKTKQFRFSDVYLSTGETHRSGGKNRN